MTSSYAGFREVRFFSSLDGLRALSIVGVIWFHSWWGTPYYPRLVAMPVLRQGSFGVAIFFAISGFLITTLLLRERERFGKISIRDFYIRRALRIWPLYYATLGLYVMLVLLFERNWRGQSFFHYLPGFLTYTYTWFPPTKSNGGIFNLAWTLATEEQFYAFWPLVLRFFRGFSSSAVMIALIALHCAVDYGWTNRILPPGSLPARILLSVSVPICLGALLAQALHSKHCFRWLYFVLGRKWSALVALAAVAASLFPTHISFAAAYLAVTALVGACVVREDNGLAFVLRLRLVAYMGVLSYGMYLLNSLSIHAVQFVLGRIGLLYPPLVFPMALGLAMAVAYLSYRFFESRFLKLKTRFSRLRPPPAERSTDSVADGSGVLVHP